MENLVRQDINKVELLGTLRSTPYCSHEYDNSKIYTLILSIDRGYENLKIVDDIKVYVTSDSDEYMKNLKVGSKYSLSGHVVFSRVAGAPSIAVACNYSDIVESDDESLDSNLLTVSGKIISISSLNVNHSNKDYIRMIIEVLDNDRRVTIRLIALNKTTVYIKNNISEGDQVTVTGSLEADRVLFTTDKYNNKIHQMLCRVGYINKKV